MGQLLNDYGIEIPNNIRLLNLEKELSLKFKQQTISFLSQFYFLICCILNTVKISRRFHSHFHFFPKKRTLLSINYVIPILTDQSCSTIRLLPRKIQDMNDTVTRLVGVKIHTSTLPRTHKVKPLNIHPPFTQTPTTISTTCNNNKGNKTTNCIKI